MVSYRSIDCIFSRLLNSSVLCYQKETHPSSVRRIFRVLVIRMVVYVTNLTRTLSDNECALREGSHQKTVQYEAAIGATREEQGLS